MADVNPDEFRRALGRFATGITVITAAPGCGRPIGMTVNSFASVSLAPPLVLFCVGDQSRHWRAFREVGHFAVNVLAEEQEALSVRFSLSQATDWSGIPYTLSPHGCPLIPGSLVSLGCGVEERLDRGDHMILLGRVDWIGPIRRGRPLVFYGRRYQGLAEPDAPCAPAPV
ncbi:MAG: flavin reductase family protein [Proteobacteria bacterium]|nr:flavin reductase family protein [Pseudomonadota bacterium]